MFFVNNVNSQTILQVLPQEDWLEWHSWDIIRQTAIHDYETKLRVINLISEG